MPCQSPIFVLQGFRDVPVPCGRCPPCRKRRVDSWVFRLLQQEKVSNSSHFVTLTYDTAHVPISEHGFMTLRKSDFQDYMKRLRKLCPDVLLRYYACGEYGSKNKRPHFHAIIFNCPDDSLFAKAWSLDGIQFGQVVVGQVSNDSIAYCCKYMNSSEFRSFHARDDRTAEFSLMSKGMGANFVTDAVKRFHNADLSRQFLTLDGGNKIAMPKYYKDRIYSEDTAEERRMLAEASTIETDRKNRLLHARVSPDMDYGDFVESQRKARVRSFNTTLKSRSL